MKVELYKMMNQFLEYYRWYNFEGKISQNDISNIFYDDKIEIPQEDIKFIEDMLNSNDRDTFLQNHITQEYAKMNEEEVSKNILEFIKEGIVDLRIISEVKDVNNLLDNLSELETENERMNLISYIKLEDIVNYLNENGKQKEIILELASYSSENFIEKLLKDLQNDSDKAKVLLYSNIDKDKMLSLIETPYFRNQLIKQTSEDNLDIEKLVKNIDKYNITKEVFNKLETEEEKAKFITTLDDCDMRLDFLEKIESKTNRDIVINSFNAEIDPEIKGQVDIVQKMIREYFEDNLGDSFDESKKERLEIIFRKSSVNFGELERNVNGRANWLADDIKISNRHKLNTNKTLGFLVHEYEHLLSHFDHKTKKTIISKTIDEGMADLFGDLVINHYLEKHGKIEIDGKKVRVDNPYETYSGYNFENAWSRTIIYGLSERGKDAEAVGEYILGDKRKFCELVFGKECTDKRGKDQFGTPDLDTDQVELYNSTKMDFSNIDFNSIYAKRNFILPIYELQNRLQSKDIDIIQTAQEGNSYFAKYIGNQYFDNRKIYEISREEMQEFNDLLVGQTNPIGESNIIKYMEFYDEKVKELSEDEIQEYSFEILDTALGMWSNIKSAGVDMERVLNSALAKETEKAMRGQSLEESLKKYRKIVPDYLEKINANNSDENKYIHDFVNDLKFSYIEQIGDALENGENQRVLNALKDEKSGEYYLDYDIEETLKQYDVKIDKRPRISFSENEVCRNVIRSVSIDLVDEASDEVHIDSQIMKEYLEGNKR